MILDDLPQPASTGVDATLDDLFRAAAARRPDAIALRDPPNRASFTDGAARQPDLRAGRPHGRGHCGTAAAS